MPARWIDAGYRSVLASRSNCPLLCFVLLLEQASSCRNVCECTDGGMSLPPEALMPSSLSNPLAILRSFRMLLSVIRTHGEYLRVPALPLPPFPTAFPVWLCSYCVSIGLKSGRSNSNYLCLSRCRYACRITPCVRACVRRGDVQVRQKRFMSWKNMIFKLAYRWYFSRTSSTKSVAD